MTSKVYKTAGGKVVDMGAIILQNETVRAVGNMSVNARGDKVATDGRVVETRSQTVAKDINRQSQQRKTDDVPTSSRRALEEDRPIVDDAEGETEE